MSDPKDTPIEFPTYMANIRHFFTTADFQCMTPQGINLETYEGVKLNALRLYFRVEDGSMPPPGSGRTWSKERVKTFYNWMKNDYPRGIAVPQSNETKTDSTLSSATLRIRKNITELDTAELALLKKAFQGIMSKSPDDPQSYFSVAGNHWLPGPNYYCRHHENAYNPWHRSYLMQFENTLRSVSGCENVTLPYWDITDHNLPDVLYDEPFANYVLPRKICNEVGFCYDAGYVTNRYDAKKIAKNIQSLYKIPAIISEALGHSHWERFNGWDGHDVTQGGIILAHDSGHNASGKTMAAQDVAAFDPIFWFFHCNWDRLWWKWQQDFQATSLDTFKTHLSGSDDWLMDPVLNGLPPFGNTTASTIDLTSMGVSYQHPSSTDSLIASVPLFGSQVANNVFTIDAKPQVSVRVKKIDRSKIPGSFDVSIKADGEVIATRGFFQSSDPKNCSNCKIKSYVNFDFVVDQSLLAGKNIQVEIMYFSYSGNRYSFPLNSCGNPTVNARLLFSE